MPSGRFPGGGAMRLSGLQNPQAARPVAPVSTARPGNIPGWRLTPYPGYEIARPTHSQPPSGRFPGGGAMRLSGLQNPQAAPTCSPGKHSATGEHSRVAANALPGLHAHNRHRAGSPDKAPLAPPPGCSALRCFRTTGGEIGLPGRRQRVYAKSAAEWRPVA
ncbi:MULTISPECIES: hypothetical protein [Klebsiella]|uniref:Uncharacterized protein n=2 Tax=Klebsiella michiganensis TaxID=1134687 RepID=A0AB35PU43_9ENTR|nr:hypothetical protein [Klebsiella michiganensis]ELT9739349.1 hypothetical protein [Klebsiella michiganensis]MBD0919978.1 hypothetical protein [Klebsiella michiganensis]MBD0957692.1 hypothetical protein [Klebsiella michiganensis]MBG2586236.1 hypothetical protein [Klebsiella michiganensis]MBG2680632.1 hypothetical protein [Klebsiella michiganensis]